MMDLAGSSRICSLKQAIHNPLVPKLNGQSTRLLQVVLVFGTILLLGRAATAQNPSSIPRLAADTVKKKSRRAMRVEF